MYKIGDSESQIMDGALRLALSQIKLPPRVAVDEAFARQFLTREIMGLHREGECNMHALANGALAQLRGHLQVRESAERLTRAG